jgi:hypothetical protein
MNQETIQVDRSFLQKFAEFTKLVLSELDNLREQISDNMQKEASLQEDQIRFEAALTKAANAMYNSDLDFITGDFDHRKFIKLAKNDPTYLARTLEKVCNAADVSLIGKPARVAAVRKKAEFDPVYAQAFGYSNNMSDGVIDWDEE